jgi:hypothetical protein
MRKHITLSLCLDILACFLLSGTIWIFVKIMADHHHPPLAVVDMQALVTRESQQLAQTRKGKVSARHIQQISEQLKGTLDAFATKHRLILLNKAALAGGENTLPDHTLDIVMLLEEGRQGQEEQQQKQEHNHDQKQEQEAFHHGLF